MLDVEQCAHGAPRRAREPSVGLTTQWRWCHTEQIQIGQCLTDMRAAGEEMRHRSLNLLPGYARGQHRKRVAQVDRVVQAGAIEIVSCSISKHQISQKLMHIGIQTWCAGYP